MPRGCFIRCATLRQIAPFIREINIFVQAQQYFCLTTRHQSTLPGLSLIACAPRFIYVYFHLHTSSVCLSSSAKGIERTWLSLLLSLSYYFFCTFLLLRRRIDRRAKDQKRATTRFCLIGSIASQGKSTQQRGENRQRRKLRYHSRIQIVYHT